MSFDLRAFSPEQKAAMRDCAEKTVFKVQRHWKLWSKPLRARNCIMPYLQKLKKLGISQETYKQFLEHQKFVKIVTTEGTGIELIFLGELSDLEVMQLLVDHDVEAMQMAEQRKIMRHNLKIRSLE